LSLLADAHPKKVLIEKVGSVVFLRGIHKNFFGKRETYNNRNRE
jgi:hypothetical protein